MMLRSISPQRPDPGTVIADLDIIAE